MKKIAVFFIGFSILLVFVGVFVTTQLLGDQPGNQDAVPETQSQTTESIASTTAVSDENEAETENEYEGDQYTAPLMTFPPDPDPTEPAQIPDADDGNDSQNEPAATEEETAADDSNQGYAENELPPIPFG